MPISERQFTQYRLERLEDGTYQKHVKEGSELKTKGRPISETQAIDFYQTSLNDSNCHNQVYLTASSEVLKQRILERLEKRIKGLEVFGFVGKGKEIERLENIALHVIDSEVKREGVKVN